MIEYKLKKAETLNEGVTTLYEIISLLRSPEGCPWDRKETSKSAISSLIDECYEYIDENVKENISGEREEIGDILLNVLMAMRIHEENEDFKSVDAINEVCEKLIRRHPHVFTDSVKASNPSEVLKVWNSVKEKERKDKNEEIFSHIPSSSGELEKSYEIQKKMKKIGFDWKNTIDVINKIKEELEEVEDAIKSENKDYIENEIGDLLFSVVNLSRFLSIRPNIALHRSNEKIKNRFLKMCEYAEKENIPLDEEHNTILNEIWDKIKEEEH